MYDAEKAQQAIDFIQALKHTKGRWAGKPFILLKWQRVLIKKLFGTVDEYGFRVYRKCYVEMPKKDGKSELGAAIALYLLTFDDEYGAEVYSAAGDKKQAGIVFGVAAEMVRKDDVLNDVCKNIDSQKRIVYYETNSFYEVLSSDVETKHGFNTHGVIFDELHGQPNRKLWDVLTDGSGIAREQPLIFAITTAGYDRNSICWEMHTYALKVKNRIIDDPHFLSMVYSLDEKADWEDEENWRKVNPALGTKEEVINSLKIIDIEKLYKGKEKEEKLSEIKNWKRLRLDLKIMDIERFRDDFNEARQKPAAINNWRRLRLNQWTSAETVWLPIEKWDACPDKIDMESLKGKVCYGGLDLSATTDLTSFDLIFPIGCFQVDCPLKSLFHIGEVKILSFNFIPRERMLDKIKTDGVDYDIWEKHGYIIATEGNVVDYNVVQAKIEECLELFQVQSIAYDRWNATQIVTNLITNGYDHMIPIGQGYQSMNAPSKYFETLILDKKFNHGGNPVLRWAFSNVMILTDPAGNIKPDKGKSKQRIDPIVAGIMALDGVMKNADSGPSVYEIRDSLYL